MTEKPRYVVRITKHYIPERNGWYLKVGGSWTPHLQEANVIGWRSVSKWMGSPLYEVVPVTIVVNT